MKKNKELQLINECITITQRIIKNVNYKPALLELNELLALMLKYNTMLLNDYIDELNDIISLYTKKDNNNASDIQKGKNRS